MAASDDANSEEAAEPATDRFAMTDGLLDGGKTIVELTEAGSRAATTLRGWSEHNTSRTRSTLRSIGTTPAMSLRLKEQKPTPELLKRRTEAE